MKARVRSAGGWSGPRAWRLGRLWMAVMVVGLVACSRSDRGSGRNELVRSTSSALSASVQTNFACPSAVTVPYTAAQTAGDLNVVVVGWSDTIATVTSVTDSKGNAYTLAVGPPKSGPQSRTEYVFRE